jgi:hypothetical protein
MVAVKQITGGIELFLKISFQRCEYLRIGPGGYFREAS